MKHILYLFISLFLFSCGNNKEETIKDRREKPKESFVTKHIGLKNVSPEFKNEIENWQDLQNLTLFIKKFENISPNEALINALELRDLVASLKDGEIPNFFDIPSFHARVNVLYNETLRLADLTLIPAITSKEVNLQINKTIAAFSSVNSKINTIYSKKRFEDAVVVKVDYIGIDSSMIDNTSKKAIKFKKRKKFMDKKNYIKKK